MKKSSLKAKNNKLSKKEIDTIFKEIRPAEKVFTPLPIPESENSISDRWVITNSSSRQSNKLAEILTWQTGQVY